MKQKHIRLIVWLSVFATVVLVTNTTIIVHFLKRNYTYSNYNGTVRYSEMKLKGRSYENRDEGYQDFLNQNPDIKDKQLYRTFRLDPWRFWEWHEWYYHYDRFTLPYISERGIQRNREHEGLGSP